MKNQLIRITGAFTFGVLLLAAAATAGTWSANNFLYQPALGARGANEKNNFDLGLNRVDAHLGQYKTLGDPGYSTLAEALTTVGSNNVTLNIPAGNITIASNTTIGSNIALQVFKGGKFTVNSGVTLTINGPIDAGPYQIFAGTGTITLGGVSTIYDSWYAVPPSNPEGTIASPLGSRFIKTSGSAPLMYIKQSGTGTTGWVASGNGSGATAFTGLSDVPSSYSGQTGKAVRVNSTSTGLEFFSLPPSGATVFTGLGDVPSSYTGQAGKALRVKSDASGLEFYAPLSTFTALADAPSSYTGQIGKSLRVNSSGTGLEFYTPSTGGATAFTALSDVPSSYSGQAGKSLRVNSSANGLEFYTPSSSGGVKPFNTLGDTGYANLSQALTTIGSTATTLVIPAEAGIVSVAGNTTIPANVDLRILKGARLDVADGVTLTINGPIEAGPYQIFSWSGSGKVDLTASPTREFSLMWWGAQSNPQGGPYTGDISAALQKAVSGACSGQDLTLPKGIFRLATPTTILRSWAQFRLHGVSVWDTQIYVDVGSSNVGLTVGEVNGDVLLHTQQLEIGKLSFIGSANCCKNALRIIETHNVNLEEVNFWCGSTSYALSVEGCLFVRGYVQVAGGTDNYGSFGVPHDGITIASSAQPYQSNVVDLKVGVHQVSGGVGVFIDGTNYHSATTRLTGSIEAVGTRPLWIYDQTLVDITNLYCEGSGTEILLDKVQSGRINGLLVNSSANVHLTRSRNCTIDNFELGSLLVIDQNCSGITVGNGGSTQYNALRNYAPDTKFTGNFAINSGADSYPMPANASQNIFYNAGFTRWQTDKPDGGWTKAASNTWTQCGSGLTDTTNRATPYCARIDVSGSSAGIYINFDTAQIQQMRGHWVNFSLWGLLASGQTFNTYPNLFMMFTVPTWQGGAAYQVGDAVAPNPTNGRYYHCVQAGTTGGSQPAWTTTDGDLITDGSVVWSCRHDGVSSVNANPMTAADVGQWKQIRVDTLCPRNATGFTGWLSVPLQANNSAAKFYISEPTVMLGRQGPRGAVLSQSEFQDWVMVGGHRVDWGTAAPNDNRWCNRGDVRYNSNAAAGGVMGWMCVTPGPAGSGALWKSMGNLAN